MAKRNKVLDKATTELGDAIGGMLECEDAIWEVGTDFMETLVLLGAGDIKPGHLKALGYRLLCVAKKLEKAVGHARVASSLLEINKTWEKEKK